MNKLLCFSILLCLLLNACRQEEKLFQLLDSKTTGIDFNNDITESEQLNIMNSEFLYNGGGVGVGDLNGDGLPDIYFTGNQVENKLYLNRGNLYFEDITAASGAQKAPGQWSSGVNILDINLDGRADIYVCNTFVKDPALRANLLFINQGNNADGVPRFREMAAEYGIADTSHSSHAQFFDCDNDGDLDLFIGVNVMDTKIPNRYIPRINDGSSQNCDRLYRNDGNHFTDISKSAGILYPGFSHSTLAADFNRDGWQDIYVANDYVSNDLLYLNGQNGVFNNHIAGIFKHQAASAMGSDAGDVNNDGLLDLFTTEMLPYYNKRKKLFIGANNYATYINNNQYGYEYQYGRNVLQLNRGFDPETGLPVFSDVSFCTGTQETEWSWTPLISDFDNDGNRDLFVTNGFPRDVTDHDFGAQFSTDRYLIPPMELQEKIPQVKSPKFLFRNKGNLDFKDISAEAGVAIPAFSNGAAYADLDNDGDLDLLVNNIDDKAFVFKNTLNDRTKHPNYLRVQLEGRPQNPDAIGAEVTAYFNGQSQIAVVASGRGYLSCPEHTLHFGLGNSGNVDSLEIRWGGMERTMIYNIGANQTLTVAYNGIPKMPLAAQPTVTPLFEQMAPGNGLQYTSDEFDYVDFNAQPTLPHKYSQYGPALSVGDVNGDGLDDLFIGGCAQRDASLFLQKNDGKFERKTLNLKSEPSKLEEDMGTLLFDADGDQDLDLYLTRGGAQQYPNWEFYQDLLCVNDGKGNFTPAPGAIPQERSCGQSVKAADFDGDGDLDLFVGGRMLPKNYPKADKSYLFRNDSKPGGAPVFTDVTQEWCPEISNIGLVSDALWTDFDNDGKTDLIIAGEWMPLVFFKNEGARLSRLQKAVAQAPVPEPSGWWTSLAAGDFDSDGDMDYIAGNFGKNTYFQCTAQEPLRVYAKDFDNNGVYDPFISCYWLDSLGRRREYFYHTRDDMLKQLISIRKKFNTYGQLGEATVQDIFSAKDLEGAQIMQANWMYSSYVENLGNGQFSISALPIQAQLAPIYGMLPHDMDNDGDLDLLMIGNDYGMELMQGRADAFYGLALQNNGKGAFKPLDIAQSGFFVAGDARALTRLSSKGQSLILAGQNRGELKIFRDKGAPPLPLAAAEMSALIQFPDGATQRREFYPGSGFLAQGSRSLILPPGAQGAVLMDARGKETRRVSPQKNKAGIIQ